MTLTALLNETLHSPIADQISLTLLHFLWQGSVIALGVLVAAWLVGQQARRRCLISSCGMLLLLACPVMTFFFLQSNQNVVVDEVAVTPMYDGLPRPSSEYGVTPFDGLGRPSYQPEVDSPSYQNDLLDAASPWVLVFWLLGVGLLSCRMVLAYGSTLWLKRTGDAAGEMLTSQARNLCRRLNMKLPAIRVSRQVSQAIVVGFFRPVVIVPAAWLIQLPPHCLEAVLAHELAHIRRFDLWINLLQRIVETLLFFHPAVWWLSGRLRQEREMCCDELAVSLTGRRVEYASTLELVARRRRASGAPALAAGIGGRKMALLNRVRNVLGLSQQSSGAGPWTLGAAAIVAAGAVWWIATGGSPLAALAADEEIFVAFDDEEGESEEERERDRERDGDREDREREGDRDRDRDREEGEREPERDGDRRDRDEERERDRDDREGERREGDRPRERDRERDGDREREGDRPREGERDRPSPEQIHRHIQELKHRMHELSEAGRHEEAGQIERRIHEIVRHFEGDREREGERDRPSPEQFRRHIEAMKRRVHELAEAGRGEEAEALERRIHEAVRRFEEHHHEREHREGNQIEVELERLHHALRDAMEEGREDEAHGIRREIEEIHHHLRREREERGERPDRPDVNREVIEAIHALREEVSRLRREVNELKEARGEHEGDRPRFDAHPPVERDRPRPDREREGDRRDR